MFIHPDDRPRRTAARCQSTLTWRARWLEHGWPSGARVSRHPTACSHHSYGVDSITRRFRADGIMKVFFNDCQASNQYGLTTQRSDRGDRELRDAKKSGKCPHAGLHCSPRHTGIVCLCEPRLVLSKRIKQSKWPKKSKNQIPLPSHSSHPTPK